MTSKEKTNNQQDDFFNYIIPKLFSSINPSVKGAELPENYKILYKRILYSRFNILQSNESQITNSLVDKVEKVSPNSKTALERVQTFQALYSKLTKIKQPTNRWAALYLLSGLSQNNNMKNLNFKASSILDTMTKNNSNLPIDNIYNDITALEKAKDQQEEIQEKIKKNTKKLSPIVVNVSKTTKMITEKDLINDIMFVFQGIDGHYITYNSDKDMFCLNHLIPFNESVVEIVSFLVELGWLYKKLKGYLTFFNESNIPSQFIQSFSSAVQSELNEYYKLISFFKKKNADKDNDDLSLKNLFLWTTEPIERMKWLALSCESVFPLRGSAVMSQIYSYVHFSGAEIYLSKVLEKISKPFFSFVQNWIQYGDLQDPYKEFFVNIIDKINDDDLWNLQYQIIYKNVPNFLNKNLALKIFEIGKCIHFIRKYCGESGYSLFKLKDVLKAQIEKAKKEEEEKMDIDQPVGIVSSFGATAPQNEAQFIDIKSYQSCLDFLTKLEISNEATTTMAFLTSLLSQVDLIHSLINKELINIFFGKFHFAENLTAINKYLLLGQGDMMQLLMESLFEELKKPASHIYKHNLQANLEAAIRASNAQYNDKECLKKLNIKLMDASTGDTGWDIFLLEYNVEVPLTVVFNRNVLKEYQKLFFFFWKIKRLEYSQDHQIWRKFMEYSHSLGRKFDFARKAIHRSMLFNQQVIHFVSNLHNFLALEVLETQYKKIVDVLPTMNSLDELIVAHKKFVENVINQSLLNLENSVIYKKIMKIFDLIIKFRSALDVLATSFLETQLRNEIEDIAESFNEHQYSTKASQQIWTSFEEFKAEITDLINTIDYFGKGNMKYLGMKLDYNNYYSILEKENENRQQQEMIEKINQEEELKRQQENNENSDFGFEENNDEFKEAPSISDKNDIENENENDQDNGNENEGGDSGLDF